MKKSQFKLPSVKVKHRLLSKRKPSAHAKKWLNTYFTEDQTFGRQTQAKSN